MKLRHHDRYDDIPLPDRADYSWPGGKRLAFCLCNNIEVFSFLDGLGSDHVAGQGAQTTRNYAWRDYGNRVGLWYLFDLLEEFGLPASHNVNSLLPEYWPRIVERILDRGDEVIAHGRTNAERQDILSEGAEEELIREATEGLAAAFGTRPQGWLGPYIVQSPVTLDLLKGAGYAYVMDWAADDQPFWMRTRAGPILSVPYSIEVNDSPALVFRHHTGRDFEGMIVDQFDEMLLQSGKRPLVCTVALHPFAIGQPYRLRALRRALSHVLEHRDDLWITTPGEIARYCAGLPPGTVPGS